MSTTTKIPIENHWSGASSFEVDDKVLTIHGGPSDGRQFRPQDNIPHANGNDVLAWIYEPASTTVIQAWRAWSDQPVPRQVWDWIDQEMEP